MSYSEKHEFASPTFDTFLSTTMHEPFECLTNYRGIHLLAIGSVILCEKHNGLKQFFIPSSAWGQLMETELSWTWIQPVCGSRYALHVSHCR